MTVKTHVQLGDIQCLAKLRNTGSPMLTRMLMGSSNDPHSLIIKILDSKDVTYGTGDR